jgi:hypothetical protein
MLTKPDRASVPFCFKAPSRFVIPPMAVDCYDHGAWIDFRIGTSTFVGTAQAPWLHLYAVSRERGRKVFRLVIVFDDVNDEVRLKPPPGFSILLILSSSFRLGMPTSPVSR